MTPSLIAAFVGLALAGAIALFIATAIILKRFSARQFQFDDLIAKLNEIEQRTTSLSTAATADLAARLERTKGDLRQETADRLKQGFDEINKSVADHLTAGRREQAERFDVLTENQSQRLAQSRQEMVMTLEKTTKSLEGKFEDLNQRTAQSLENIRSKMDERLQMVSSEQAEKLNALTENQSLRLMQSRQEMVATLDKTTKSLETKFEELSQKTAQNLENIRNKVDERLQLISAEVQKKLNENIQEGFAQFEKVQQHLKAAEERLKEVGAVGASINDLNSLLKLPHLRGKFGEASLERLLADFLPQSMYEIQTSAGEGLRPDAIIRFPDRYLPIDSKFPREQVLPLFESNDPAILVTAREKLALVIREQAKSITRYIRPEDGSTDMALMFLPSETLWYEVIQNNALTETLNKMKIYPVSPNTLLLALSTIAQAHKWYQVVAGFKETREQLAQAQKKFGHFLAQFENIGKSLNKAQDSYNTATMHLSTYKSRITNLTGVEVQEIGMD